MQSYKNQRAIIHFGKQYADVQSKLEIAMAKNGWTRVKLVAELLKIAESQNDSRFDLSQPTIE